MMDVDAIRQADPHLVESRGHKIVDWMPLVLRDDPSTPFTGSGMQPLVKYLLGEEYPSGTQLAEVQPCLRSRDLEEVGDSRQTTLFEMLGNEFGSSVTSRAPEANMGSTCENRSGSAASRGRRWDHVVLGVIR